MRNISPEQLELERLQGTELAYERQLITIRKLHDELDAARAALAAPVAQTDCRTCQNVSIRSGGCSSVFLCVDASMYKASPQVRYWKDKP
jgi:hypothetical protein